MKDEMIPELERDGGLSQVVFTTVNTDEKPTLSRRLLRGTSIPQLVLFTRTPKGWRRSQLTGVHEPGLIRQFIRREIVAAREAGDVPTSAGVGGLGGDRRPSASHRRCTSRRIPAARRGSPRDTGRRPHREIPRQA